jgi:hypothetical protein
MTILGRLHTSWIAARVPIALALLVAAGACSGGASSSGASGRVTVPDISGPRVVPPVKVSDWQYLWTRVPRSSKHQCVAVHTGWTAARSDTFVVGNFADYIQSWDGTTTTSKLAYTPRYPDANQPPLRVTATPLDGQAGSPLAGLDSVSYAWGEDGIPFYATGTLLTHRGRWRLIAAAGRNWGCFDLTV